MKHLLAFRVACVVLQVVCFAALYVEIFMNNIESMTAVYVWAGLAIAGLVGNAVGAIVNCVKY